MLVSRFPEVTFIDQGGAETLLDLSSAGHEIAERAASLDARLGDAHRVGLVFRSGPDLVLGWLAVLASGREPLILQYPTRKQTWLDWSRSVAHTVEVAALDAVLADDSIPSDTTLALPVIPLARNLAARGAADRGVPPLAEIPDGSILQLSSGTTGHRKPIRFTLDQAKRHVAAYANVLLSPAGDDCIVSWLPLYHDMGLVACFLLPLLTGTRLVMMDPMNWLARPTLLFDAIERHQGTICFMPNFGFEVMARTDTHGPFPTMRRWISCSEPVYEGTMRRFMEATGAQDETIQACYAMAENVFAVTQSEGFVAVEAHGERRVSCGFPIPDCDVEIRDGQIWVRSGASIERYVGGEPIVDEDGFYPTGDLGSMTAEGLVVSGRVHDLINVAGRKHLLNDLDRVLNQVVPEARGRAVTCAHRVAELGTEQPVFFAEDPSFYDRRGEEPAIQTRLTALSGIETLDFHFVPPGFITKTSSGKANRTATMKNWLASEDLRRSRPQLGGGDIEAEIRQYLGDLPFDQPVEELLDSLGLVLLKLTAEAYGTAVSPGSTLAELVGSVAQGTGERTSSDPDGHEEHVSIVSVGDARILFWINEDALRRYSDVLGCPVSFEHLCLPPTPVLLQDLIFHDYFLARGRTEHFRAVETALHKVKNASLLIVDDIAELAYPLEQAYPQLDARFRRGPDADLLAFRWQQYTRYHHHLPIKAVEGPQLPEDRNPSIEALSRYIGAPVFRIASLPHFEDVTRGWEFIDRRNRLRQRYGVGLPKLPEALGDYLEREGGALRRIPGKARVRMNDLVHFCGSLVDEDRLIRVLDSYDTFCILGAPSSVPFITRYLTERKKPFFHSNALNLDEGSAEFDCVLMTGALGTPNTDKPVYQIFSAESPDATHGYPGHHFAHPRIREARDRVSAMCM